MKEIRIVLADDHQIVRQGLQSLLNAETDMRVIGQAATGLEAVELTDQLRPDILVTDLMMPELNGLEVTRQALQRSPGTRVIVLSMHANEAYVLQAMRNGALGYVLKDSSLEELVLAVRTVLREDRYLSEAISDDMLQLYQQKERQSALDDPYETLTNREREILQMVVEGLSSSQIAERLVISTRTVETHRANLMRKLNLNSQAELIRFAIRKGIVLLDG
ncbi:MAG TPA: DNA-binding response regulator [Chloroflexi bacterium]|nr:DNA-binding response regulator [Chloroflexota bacterium]HBY09375.1 DNA-binding response regulator [Chloroflexota bacterium]